MGSAHNDQTPTLLVALTEVVQKLEDSRLSVGLQEVTTADQTLTTIRAISNHSAPINRIPEEILVHVFKYACTRPRASAESMPDHAVLIAITHVCRRWRAVAVGCAVLWSHISLRRKSALAFEKRSKTSLLTVYVSVRGKNWEKRKPMLRRLQPRVQTLHVKATWMEELRKLMDTLSSQQITSLSLQVNIKRDSTQRLVPHSSSSRTTPLMLGGFSSGLRSLTIVTEDYWRIPLGRFPALTNLRLFNNRGAGIDSTSFNRLLSFLSNTPNLEDLDVRTRLPFYESQEPPSTASEEPVSLTRLRQLRLVMGDVFALYSKLSVRDNAMVTLVGVPSNLPIRDAHIQPGAFTAVELLCHGHCAIFRARDAYRSLELCYLNTVWSAGADWHPRYLSAVETLSLTITTGIFTKDYTMLYFMVPSHIWLDLPAFLAHAPLLQTLYIRDVNTTTISHLVRVLTQTDPAPALCPQLRTLTLSLVSPSGCLTDLQPLLRATEERARRGVPLESVTICSPWHRTLNPRNVLFNLGGAHGLQWLLLCDRDLYHPADSSADGYSDFCEQAVRKFRRHWVARARENEGNDFAGGDIVDA